MFSIFLASPIKNIIAVSEQYSIKNVEKYTDEFGYLYILGEIKNESKNPLVNITLIGNFYDRNGKLMDEYYRYPEITTLNPFENSPFQIIYLDPSTSNKVNNYTITAKYQTGKIKPAELIVESLNDKFDINGFYYINGNLKNNGTEEANNVTVIATIYDKDGKVIGLTKAITVPFSIPSKGFGAFSLVITFKSQAPKIQDFSVKAYSDKYLSQTVTTKNNS
ncbi:MAG: FxLYD domain-containing protein [Nitrososphaeraceae archaeon]|nr:FxLYD domain-containing protein [Nitrososphaeraceae archaeon]